MKELLHEIVRGAAAPGPALNAVREYLQARLLGGLQRAGGMRALAFCGGTALRFLHRLPRYSEDLDFTLEDPAGGFALRPQAEALAREFRAEGYELRVRLTDRTAVHSAWFRFPGLLHALGLSSRREQAIAVKLELDTRPPQGAVCETSLIRRHLTLRLHHHDRASLFAGKLHAVLARPHPKGRDFFDLLWYLADSTWPGPNLSLLSNALRQTGHAALAAEAAAWPRLVQERLDGLAFAQIAADVAPFLEQSADLSLLTRENLAHLLAGR